jgi:hypothetical protein
VEPISVRLMDLNCKPIHTRAYIVPRSVEQQFQQCKEISRLVDIEVLEEEYFFEWASIFQTFTIPKKNGAERIRDVTDFRNLNVFLKL